MSADKQDQDLVKNDDPKVNQSRRKFSRAGFAAPVIMALANRPAFGAVCTVSGFISVDPNNMSADSPVVKSCGGLSPGAYKTPYNGAGTWPSGYSPGGPNAKVTKEGFGKRPSPKGTFMKEAFGYDGLFKDNTMYDVLWMKGNQDQYQLGAHLVAALLNAAGGHYINGLTVAEVKDMYKQMSTGGFYEAAPGVLWDAETLVDFIQSTFH